jgi:hypothetical protein
MSNIKSGGIGIDITPSQDAAPCRFPKIKVLAQVWVLAQVLPLALALALALLLGPSLWR